MRAGTSIMYAPTGHRLAMLVMYPLLSASAFWRSEIKLQSENLLMNTKIRAEKWERGDAYFHPFVYSLYATALRVQSLLC